MGEITHIINTNTNIYSHNNITNIQIEYYHLGKKMNNKKL